MLLYHGSNQAVEKPRIIESKRNLDFGIGFYCTTDFEQARKWAINVTRRNREGTPIVSVYEYNENNDLKVLRFDKPEYNWLKFVCENRKNKIDNDNDIIYGPVANDNTLPIIDLYLSGYYNEQQAIERLLPQKLKNQITFKTPKSLEYLKIERVITIEKDAK